jgi:catechol 2,3-dioxygenase-like lactoylglutathione lyase family enzyme
MAYSFASVCLTFVALAIHRVTLGDAFTARRSTVARYDLQRVTTNTISCQESAPHISCTARKASDVTEPTNITSHAYTHHIALKTRNIENAINFYSLLGFRVESKFIADPARAAWLIHRSDSEKDVRRSIASRIELLEVPPYMLDEPEGMKRQALDLSQRVELLGLNHFALDVTHNIPKTLEESDRGTACELYQLKEWLDDVNQESIAKFGRALRIAMEPTKRRIGREVYEMAFIYDADGVLVELLNHVRTVEDDTNNDDGWGEWGIQEAPTLEDLQALSGVDFSETIYDSEGRAIDENTELNR